MKTPEPKWYQKKGLIALGAIVAGAIAVSASSTPPPAAPIAAPAVQTPIVTQQAVPAPEQKAAPAKPIQKQQAPDRGLSNNTYYTNTAGNEVHSPAYSNSVPAGASAQCRDGSYSFSQSRRGTCSHHGGVAEWL